MLKAQTGDIERGIDPQVAPARRLRHLGRQNLAAVRVLGASGKVKVIIYDAGRPAWR